MTLLFSFRHAVVQIFPMNSTSPNPFPTVLVCTPNRPCLVTLDIQGDRIALILSTGRNETQLVLTQVAQVRPSLFPVRYVPRYQLMLTGSCPRLIWIQHQTMARPVIRISCCMETSALSLVLGKMDALRILKCAQEEMEEHRRL